jgi:hypothetical protein
MESDFGKMEYCELSWPKGSDLEHVPEAERRIVRRPPNNPVQQRPRSEPLNGSPVPLPAPDQLERETYRALATWQLAV